MRWCAAAILLGAGAGVLSASAGGKRRALSGISREEKSRAVGHRGVTLWMTGLIGSGKTTIAVALERALLSKQDRRFFVHRLDIDHLRHGLNRNAGSGAEGRRETTRRIAEVAKLFADAGAIVICSLVSPYKGERDRVRAIHLNASLPYLEVYVDAPLSVVQRRDTRGIYARVRQGQIRNVTGVDAPYDVPEAPDVHLKTAEISVLEAVNAIMSKLDDVGIIVSQRFRAAREDDEEQAHLQARICSPHDAAALRSEEAPALSTKDEL